MKVEAVCKQVVWRPKPTTQESRPHICGEKAEYYKEMDKWLCNFHANLFGARSLENV